VVEQLRESLRREAGSIDVVILAGGGAPYYREAVLGAFEQSRVMMSEYPERANARGFFYFGEM
jgi:plasmid segregation protein ParM